MKQNKKYKFILFICKQFFQINLINESNLTVSLPDGWLVRLSNDLKAPFNISASNLNKLVGGPDRTQCYISGNLFY